MIKSLFELAMKTYLENNTCIKCYLSENNFYKNSFGISCGHVVCHEILLDILMYTQNDRLPILNFDIWKYNGFEWRMCHPLLWEILISFERCLVKPKEKLELAMLTGNTNIVLSTYREVEEKIINEYCLMEYENTVIFFDSEYTLEKSYVEISVLRRCLSHYGEMYNVKELMRIYPSELHLPWERDECLYLMETVCYIYPKEKGIKIHQYYYEKTPFFISLEDRTIIPEEFNSEVI